MKIGLISLGCSKNLVDSELMLGTLHAAGFIATNKLEKAEILIVNSCGFIESAKKESIEAILRLAEYKRTGACRVLILAGCLGQRYSDDLMKDLPEIDAIVGTGAWNRLPEVIQSALQGMRTTFTDGNSILPDASMPRIRSTPDYMAYVKISEGCNHSCAFCAIPQIRGALISRSIESIRQEVSNLVAEGVKEIILVAQDTTSYGIDLYGRPRLVDLLKELCSIEGRFWLRILYSYPKNFSNDLIQLMACEPKICKYVDIPLQHVNDDLLRAMRRPDRRKDIESLIEDLRTAMPDVAIRTTFIVGLPGETEEHYQDLRRFVETKRLDHVGVFVYSPEEGTDAAGFSGQVDEELKSDRYDDLMAVQAEISEKINQAAEGKIYEAIVEDHTEDDRALAHARTCREAPDIDGTVYVENAAAFEVGEFVNVRIVQGFCYDRMAEIVD